MCVYCGRQPIEPAWRPFCSERCKLLDLRNWLDERYRIPEDDGSSLPDQDHAPDDAEVEDRDRGPDV